MSGAEPPVVLPRRITVHVLDTTRGRPGAGIELSIARLDGEDRTVLATVRTNDDGRTDGPVIQGEDVVSATYEVRFSIGDHFAGRTGEDAASAALPFLDIVPVRFTLRDGDQHVHIALLASPWSYTTYRGS